MLCGLALNIYVWGFTRVPWTWYVTIGSITTFVVGYAASMMEGSTAETDGAKRMETDAGR
jgi:hypothetical protein